VELYVNLGTNCTNIKGQKLLYQEGNKLTCAIVSLDTSVCILITDHTCNSNGGYKNEHIIFEETPWKSEMKMGS
jgi:hypothetical protein